MKKDDLIGILTLHNAAKLNEKEQAQVADWLERWAASIRAGEGKYRPKLCRTRLYKVKSRPAAV